jgi:hypothetical protein
MQAGTPLLTFSSGTHAVGKEQVMEKQHWQDWLTGLVGVWLIVSPYVFAFAVPEGVAPGLVIWNFILSGAAAVILSVAALASYRIWEEWADVLLGLWLVASPWLLQFAASPTARWNAIISGLVIVASAGWTLMDDYQTGGA